MTALVNLAAALWPGAIFRGKIGASGGSILQKDERDLAGDEAGSWGSAENCV